VSGDLGLLIQWGGGGDFALSVGGFNPRYKAVPDALKSLERLTIDLSPPAVVKIVVKAYFAVTAGAADLVSNGSGLRTKPILGAMYELDLLVPPDLKGADAKTLIEADQPMQLVLTLKSGLINRKRFVETTTGGFAKAAKSGYECAKTPDFLAQFDDTVFRKGDIVLMAYGPDGLTTTYRKKSGKEDPAAYEDQALGTLPGLNLKKALFAIWLGDTPAQASLKKALLGTP